ncbi:MAG: PH domain-containing protein [Methanosphaera sp.]|nr:PH domain-containing protein [Methanosphaera sp.]
MGIINRAIGNADVNQGGLDRVEEYFFNDEQVIQHFQFIRDQVILTNYGLYDVDRQGLTGKKTQVDFYPKHTIKMISFETAGHIDFDVEIKIGVECNCVVKGDKVIPNKPIEIEVGRAQAEEAKEIVRLVKYYYLFDKQ